MNTTKPKPFVRTTTKKKFYRHATYAVHGFWSWDSVRVIQSVDYQDSSKWEEPRISWSTGGADNEQEPDRVFAAECFAAALKNAAKLARRWRGGQGA